MRLDRVHAEERPGAVSPSTAKEFMRIQGIVPSAALAGLLCCLGAQPLQAQHRTETRENRGALSEKDYKFLADAARGGTMEVQLGELARQKGVSQSVRNFGEKMVADHTKANDELKQIATQKGATIPVALSHHEHSAITQLQKESGPAFDKAYAKDMAKDHRNDVKDFQNAAKEVADPDLRAWVQKTLPVLEQHLRLAQDMEAAVKNER